MKQNATFRVWAINRPGVLLRLTTMFTRRKVNIESLTVSQTAQQELSHFTILVKMEWQEVEKLARKIQEIVDVKRVAISKDNEIHYRDIALYRIDPKERERAFALAFEFRARLVEDAEEFLLFEKSGEEKEIDTLHSRFSPLGLLEFVRSGRVACAVDCSPDLISIT